MNTADNEAAEKLADKAPPWWTWLDLLNATPLQGTLFQTYVTLRSFGDRNKDGSIKPVTAKISTIAKRRHLAGRTVRRHLNLLEEGGYIRRERRGARGLYHYFFTDGQTGHDLLAGELKDIPGFWRQRKVRADIIGGQSDEGRVAVIGGQSDEDDAEQTGQGQSGADIIGGQSGADIIGGQSEGSLKKALRENDNGLTADRPQPTASLCASKANNKQPTATAPVKSRQQTANDKGFRDGKGPTKVFSQSDSNGPPDEQVQEIAALLTPSTGAVLHSDKDRYTDQARRMLSDHTYEECVATLQPTGGK